MQGMSLETDIALLNSEHLSAGTSPTQGSESGILFHLHLSPALASVMARLKMLFSLCSDDQIKRLVILSPLRSKIMEPSPPSNEVARFSALLPQEW